MAVAVLRPASATRPPGLVGSAIAVAAVALLPVAYLVIRVATAGEVAWAAVTSASALAALGRTVALAAAVTATTLALGVGLGWLTSRTSLPGRRLWAVLLALPLAVPSYVGAFTFIGFFGPGGILPDLVGSDRGWAPFGFGGAWAALSLFTYPYVLLPVRAALARMDRGQEETARGLGASGWKVFRRVTLPQLRPAIVAGGLVAGLYAISDFGAVSLLRYDSLTRVIFIQYQTAFDRTTAAALALLLVVVAVAALAAEQGARGRARYHARAARRPAAVLPLGRWRWPAMVACAAVALAGLGVPLVVMVSWLVRDLLGAAASLSGLGRAALHSVTASGLAAGAAVAASIPVAGLIVRYPARVTDLVERSVYSGLGLPGISIALALVFFAARYATPIYQTLALLVFAYVLRFLPQAVGAARTSLGQVNPHTEESARSLGARPLAVLRRVTLPQIAPGLVAGAFLVWLTAMKELPMTLLLGPAGFDTLATQLWSHATAGFLARAAAPALVLVVVSGIPLALMALRREVRPE
ncbi:MAG TPA: iron ABC transporter permease [Actinomycetota bacterium]|nr:iron ABC transporter permease [Actinomycetota bacterium]